MDLPYELLLINHAIILGQHRHGRIVLALREMPSCPLSLLEKYAASHSGRHLNLLRQFVTATAKLTKALCVEYIAAAEDGLGRLYARQVSAQSLPREARYLLFGQTHKEVDMSGAHYEILRRVAGATHLPPIQQLRETIRAGCHDAGGDSLSFIKLLPLRLLNTGAERTLQYAKDNGYTLSAYAVSLLREIEALRDIYMPKILCAKRQELAVSFRNRNSRLWNYWKPIHAHLLP